ncbi:MAG: hypothetical protein H7Y42_08985 [Chitinophagaceae bacterium]|nr:hypothetical protein [Chitinophagaceae bacterium]
MDFEKVLPPIISGFFAFGGAYLAIRSQRDNWLLQKRADVFSQFLTDFLEFRQEVVFTADDERLCIAQEKINTSANKVCLFLSKTTRKEFRDTFDEYMRFTPDFSKATNLIGIKESYAPKFELERNFQLIFERVLCGTRGNCSWLSFFRFKQKGMSE